MESADKIVNDLLFELGMEEIPAKFIPGAVASLKELAEKALTEARLEFGEVRTFGTPRRLTLLVDKVSDLQGDLTVTSRGPAVKTAFDSEGNPTRAAIGFAAGQGVDPSQLEIRTGPGGGEYVWATKIQKGKPTLELLPDLLKGVVDSMTFPKTMRWGANEYRFARPIRWIVALFGDSIIPLEIVKVASGRISKGHRFLSDGDIVIDKPEDYLGKLAEAYVIVDHHERRQEIWRQVTVLAGEFGGSVESDEELLEEVTNLVEWPTALYGSVPAEYAHLPKAVITTPMKDHQRYFPVVKGDGSLLPMFITVRNGGEEGIENVRAGNERVLNARLADARFFYDEDIKTPLGDRIDDLKRVIFHEKLGTIFEKVQRIKALSAFLSAELKVSQEHAEAAARASELSKADLVTHMVYEFTELQGVMGREYALKSGEKPEVALAIAEHYMPRNAADTIPTSIPGTIAALADKMDSISGAFAIGIQPTGSADPYGLRRQALGISNIILSGNLHLDIDNFIGAALVEVSKYAKVPFDRDKVAGEIKDFFVQRVRNIFLDRDYRYDVVDAVLADNSKDLVDSCLRIQALQDFRETEDIQALLAARNRASNLSKKAEFTVVNTGAFTEDCERQLYTAYLEVKKDLDLLLSGHKYKEALELLLRLNAPLEAFFDGVMVMVDDQAIRDNRLSLLKLIAGLYDSVADMGRLVE